MRRCIVVGTKDSGLGTDGWKGLYPSIRRMQNGLSVTVGQNSDTDLLPSLGYLFQLKYSQESGRLDKWIV
jgi:hypothetical protein